MIEYIIIGTLAFALLKSRKGVSGIGSPRRVFGGNSGYVNYSKSKRAVQAEEEGKRSISHFDRAFVEQVNAILATVGAEPLTIAKAKRIAQNTQADEWHHTSMYGNKTSYYSPETIAVAAMTDEQQALHAGWDLDEWRENDRKKEEIRREEEQRDREILLKRLYYLAINYIEYNRDELNRVYGDDLGEFYVYLGDLVFCFNSEEIPKHSAFIFNVEQRTEENENRVTAYMEQLDAEANRLVERLLADEQFRADVDKIVQDETNRKIQELHYRNNL